MEHYTVLVVENQEDIHTECARKFPPGSPVRILPARTFEEAVPLINDNFIHLALVDINLSNDRSSPNLHGEGVLRRLTELRPACRRIAYTISAGEALRNFARGPDPLVDGVLPKQYNWTDIEFIEHNAAKWLQNRVRVDGLDAVLEDIRRKSGPPHPLRDELDHLVSRIFGQGEQFGTSIASVSLQLLDGGRSRSVVVLGQPMDGGGRLGIRTVIKFSRSDYAAKEHSAYCNHVRFMLPVSHRVELLGYFEADTLGAMCYSFAGAASTDEITSVEQLMRDEDESALQCLSSLNEPMGGNWHVPKGFIDQWKYFVDTFEVNERKVQEKIHAFAVELAERIGANVQMGGIKLGGRVLHWPTSDDLGDMGDRWQPQCIVHGDLHAGNILVRKGTKQAVLIDHQYTGPGPACLDFSSLDASPRLFTRLESLDRNAVEDQIDQEPKIWDAAWTDDVGSTAPGEFPFWARASYTVIMLARARFPELTPMEYAGTCLLWALRVFKVQSLEPVPRGRLFVWISHLLSVLRARRAAPAGAIKPPPVPSRPASPTVSAPGSA